MERFKFDPAKFVALAEYIWERQRVSAEKLELLIWNIDIDAYRKLGAPITGATYVKGPRHPEVANVGRGWFRAFVRDRTPRWARLAAWPLTVYVLLSGRSRP